MSDINFTDSRATTATAVKSPDYVDYTMYDGYDWMQKQSEQLGLKAIPELGDWPYVVIVKGYRKDSDCYIVKEYSEHDVKVWIYPAAHEGKQQMQWHLAQFREYWKERNPDMFDD